MQKQQQQHWRMLGAIERLRRGDDETKEDAEFLNRQSPGLLSSLRMAFRDLCQSPTTSTSAPPPPMQLLKRMAQMTGVSLSQVNSARNQSVGQQCKLIGDRIDSLDAAFDRLFRAALVSGGVDADVATNKEVQNGGMAMDRVQQLCQISNRDMLRELLGIVKQCGGGRQKQNVSSSSCTLEMSRPLLQRLESCMMPLPPPTTPLKNETPAQSKSRRRVRLLQSAALMAGIALVTILLSGGSADAAISTQSQSYQQAAVVDVNRLESSGVSQALVNVDQKVVVDFNNPTRDNNRIYPVGEPDVKHNPAEFTQYLIDKSMDVVYDNIKFAVGAGQNASKIEIQKYITPLPGIEFRDPAIAKQLFNQLSKATQESLRSEYNVMAIQAHCISIPILLLINRLKFRDVNLEAVKTTIKRLIMTDSIDPNVTDVEINVKFQTRYLDADFESAIEGLKSIASGNPAEIKVFVDDLYRRRVGDRIQEMIEMLQRFIGRLVAQGGKALVGDTNQVQSVAINTVAVMTHLKYIDSWTAVPSDYDFDDIIKTLFRNGPTILTVNDHEAIGKAYVDMQNVFNPLRCWRMYMSTESYLTLGGASTACAPTLMATGLITLFATVSVIFRPFLRGGRSSNDVKSQKTSNKNPLR